VLFSGSVAVCENKNFRYRRIVAGRKLSNCRREGVFFTERLGGEYSFLKDQQVGKVLCSICKSQFSIQHGRLSDILQYIKKRKHEIAAESKSYCEKVTFYFMKETVSD
jgi:hypothetical protein